MAGSIDKRNHSIGIEAAYRRSALRVISALLTESTDAEG